MVEVKDGKNPPDIASIVVRVLKAQIQESHERMEGYEFEEVNLLIKTLITRF